jgi:hypothetical protein
MQRCGSSTFANQVRVQVTGTGLSVLFCIIKMEFWKQSRSKKNLNAKEEDLVDKDKDIFDTVPSFDSLGLYKDVM